MMYPAVSRMVVVKGFNSHGQDEQPAVITRVHDEGMVNLMVLPDGAIGCSPALNVPFVKTRSEALGLLLRKGGKGLVAFWPEHVADIHAKLHADMEPAKNGTPASLWPPGESKKSSRD